MSNFSTNNSSNRFSALEMHFTNAGCHDPLPVVILLAAMEYRDSAEDKGTVNTFKLY